MQVSVFFKNTKPWGRLFALGFIFVVCSLMASLFPLPSIDETATASAIREHLAGSALVQLVVFLLSANLFAILFHGTPKTFFQLASQGRHWFLALVAVLVWILLIPAIDWLAMWNDTWYLGPMEEPMRKMSHDMLVSTERMLSLTSTGDLLLQIVVVAFVPALCEEVFFRGALQPTMQSLTRNGHWGIVLTAVIFSLAHGDMFGFLPRIVLGLLLGYLYYQSGSMIVNVSVHFFNNMVIVVAYHFFNTGYLAFSPADALRLPCVLTIGCTLGAILLFYIYFMKSKKISNY